MKSGVSSEIRKVQVAVLAPENAVAWTLLGPADMLSHAGSMWAGLYGEHETKNQFEVSIVGHLDRPITYSYGMQVTPKVSLDDNTYSPDVALVPTLFEGSVNFGRPGWSKPWRPFIEWIHDRHTRGTRVGAISSGSALLAETSLLDHRKATTHWAIMETMAAHYPCINFVDRPIVSAAPDSRLVTTAAGTAWQLLVILLIARYMGAEQAVELAHLFSVEKFADEKCSFLPSRDHGDAMVLRAQRTILRNSSNPDVLARAMEDAGLSRRTFERRFRTATEFSPLAYLQRTRMQRARHLLDATTSSIGDVAVTVGYTDIAYFRDLFLRTSGFTPSDYREKFGMGKLLHRARDII